MPAQKAAHTKLEDIANPTLEQLALREEWLAQMPENACRVFVWKNGKLLFETHWAKA